MASESQRFAGRPEMQRLDRLHEVWDRAVLAQLRAKHAYNRQMRRAIKEAGLDGV